MGERFSLLGRNDKHLPQWIRDIKYIALNKARKYGWADHQPEMAGTHSNKSFRQEYSFTWSFDVDDMINEGCLAYLKAIETPGIEHPESYAKKAAANAMGNLRIMEARSHGLVYNYARGGIVRATGISQISRLGGRRNYGSPKGTVVGKAAMNAAATHCKRGHEFTPENTYLAKRKDGGTNVSRICKTCKKANSAARAARPEEKIKTRLRQKLWYERKKRGMQPKVPLLT